MAIKGLPGKEALEGKECHPFAAVVHYGMLPTAHGRELEKDSNIGHK